MEKVLWFQVIKTIEQELKQIIQINLPNDDELCFVLLIPSVLSSSIASLSLALIDGCFGVVFSYWRLGDGGGRAGDGDRERVGGTDTVRCSDLCNDFF